MFVVSAVGRVTKGVSAGEKNGTKWLKFTLMCYSRQAKSNIFLNCVLFKRSAEFFAEQISEGTTVAITGQLTVDDSKRLNCIPEIVNVIKTDNERAQKDGWTPKQSSTQAEKDPFEEFDPPF